MSDHFITDQQTLNDLNLFGRRGSESIHSIFDHTATSKGSLLLEELLRYPLGDAAAINRRSTIIQQFAAAKTEFPLRGELFDVTEHYLSDTDERSRLAGREKGWGNRLSSMIANDNEYKSLYKGIMALLEILQSLRTFISKVAPGCAWYTECREAAELLAKEDWQPLLQANYKKNIPYDNVVQFDSFLRFRHREQVYKLLQHIYYLDVYIAIARIANEKQWIFPKALAASPLYLRMEEVTHPALAKAVPNSIGITTKNNLIFLTGANMAGKSTLMKTMGIVLFLAHAGFPVPARAMEFSVLDGIFTSINLPDNLGLGASHFYAEVLRVKKVAKELHRGKRLFVLFDELFRGTNVKDAGEGTIAITRGFARKKDSVFMISTHIVEAGEVLQQQCDNIRFLYLPTHMQDNQPVYTYQLAEGITDDRHGMIIINNEGILEILKSGRES